MSMEEENVYNYYLEIKEDGNLYMVTEYMNGYITEWTANATIEVNDEVYFINLYED